MYYSVLLIQQVWQVQEEEVEEEMDSLPTNSSCTNALWHDL